MLNMHIFLMAFILFTVCLAFYCAVKACVWFMDCEQRALNQWLDSYNCAPWETPTIERQDGRIDETRKGK